MPKVIYGTGVRFEFSSDIVLRHLYEYWRTWLQQRLDSGANEIELPSTKSSESEPFPEGIIMDLIQGGAGTAFCPICEQTIPAALLKVENWHHGSLMGAAYGRELYCQRGHELLRVWDGSIVEILRVRLLRLNNLRTETFIDAS